MLSAMTESRPVCVEEREHHKAEGGAKEMSDMSLLALMMDELTN